jgi:low affinity Fe/Cu permease
LNDLFAQLSRKASDLAGRPATFAGAVAVLVIWALTGPLLGWSDTWQLIINTGTTIVTFLLVFLIQSSQNRDAAAMQLKLDDIICSLDKADNKMISLERATDREVEEARRSVTSRKES